LAVDDLAADLAIAGLDLVDAPGIGA
jgi:hypothetical protein